MLERDRDAVIEVAGAVTADERKKQREECQRADDEPQTPPAPSRRCSFLPHVRSNTEVVPAALHNDAGIVGAALSAPT